MIRLLSLLTLLFIASCGFTPMYGTSGEGKLGLDKVEISMIPDQSGVYLRNILIDHFYENGYPADPTHILTIEQIRETKSDLDITVDSEATRRQLHLTATMVLKDKITGTTVLTRKLSAITSYNVLGSQFTTRVSENDAREAGLEELARQVESQLVLYFKR